MHVAQSIRTIYTYLYVSMYIYICICVYVYYIYLCNFIKGSILCRRSLCADVSLRVAAHYGVGQALVSAPRHRNASYSGPTQRSWNAAVPRRPFPAEGISDGGVLWLRDADSSGRDPGSLQSGSRTAVF